MHSNVTLYQRYQDEYVCSENSYLIHRLMSFRRRDALKCDSILKVSVRIHLQLKLLFDTPIKAFPTERCPKM